MEFRALLWDKVSRKQQPRPPEWTAASQLRAACCPIAHLHSAVTLGQAAPRVAWVQFIEILVFKWGSGARQRDCDHDLDLECGNHEHELVLEHELGPDHELGHKTELSCTWD